MEDTDAIDPGFYLPDDPSFPGDPGFSRNPDSSFPGDPGFEMPRNKRRPAWMDAPAMPGTTPRVGSDNPPLPGQQLAPLMPFGQPEALKLQRYMGGLSEADTALENDEITPEQHAEYHGMLAPIVNQLLKRQQATQQQQEAQAAAQMQKQAAMQQGLQEANAVHTAQNFQNKTAIYTDPMTGDMTHFYQEKPGVMKPIPSEYFPSAMAMVAGASPEDGDAAAAPADEDRETRPSKDSPEYQAAQAEQEKQQGQTSGRKIKDVFLPVDGFKPTESQQQVMQAAQSGKEPPRAVRQQAMRDRQAQLSGQPRDATLNEAQLRHLWDVANRSVGGTPGHARDMAVNRLHDHLVQEHTRRAAQADLAEQRRQGKVTAEENKAQIAEHKEAVDKHYKYVVAERKDMVDRLDRVGKDTPAGQKILDESPHYLMGDPDEMMDEAIRRAKRNRGGGTTAADEPAGKAKQDESGVFGRPPRKPAPELTGISAEEAIKASSGQKTVKPKSEPRKQEEDKPFWRNIPFSPGLGIK